VTAADRFLNGAQLFLSSALTVISIVAVAGLARCAVAVFSGKRWY
jgi:hypothetical protein